MEEVKNAIDFNLLSYKQKTEWLRNPDNLLFEGGNTTISIIKPPFQIKDSKKFFEGRYPFPPTEIVNAHLTAWWEANRRNFYEKNCIHLGLNEFELPEEKEKIFNNRYEEWNRPIKNKTRIFTSLRDKFIYTHGLKSFKNDIIGRTIFYFFVSIIMYKKKIIDISSSDFTEENFFKPFIVIVMQDSGSGKDESLKILKDLNNLINEKLPEGERITRTTYETGTTVETLIRRPKFDKNGQPKVDPETLEAIEIPGTIEEYDWMYSSECSHLFGKNQKNSSPLNFLLCAWNWEPFEKTLSGWNGYTSTTIPRAAFIGLSRPVPEVKEIIANSGLLQRTIFLPRDISLGTKKGMIEKRVNVTKKESKMVKCYRKELVSLSKDFLSLISKQTSNTFTYNEKQEEEIFQRISDFGINSLNYLENLRNAFIVKTMSTFVTRVVVQIQRLAQLCAFYRNKNVIDLKDVEEAISFFDELFKTQLPWLESSIIVDEKKRKETTNLELWVVNEFRREDTIKRSELIKFVRKKLNNCAHVTADKKIDNELVGSRKSNRALHFIDKEGKLLKINPTFL